MCKELCKTCKEAAKNDYLFNKSKTNSINPVLHPEFMESEGFNTAFIESEGLNTAFMESEGMNTSFTDSGESSDKENSGDVNNKMAVSMRMCVKKIYF